LSSCDAHSLHLRPRSEASAHMSPRLVVMPATSLPHANVFVAESYACTTVPAPSIGRPNCSSGISSVAISHAIPRPYPEVSWPTSTRPLHNVVAVRVTQLPLRRWRVWCRDDSSNVSDGGDGDARSSTLTYCGLRVGREFGDPSWTAQAKQRNIGPRPAGVRTAHD
jgi:hypothetical protein